jgi:hypothetical protein
MGKYLTDTTSGTMLIICLTGLFSAAAFTLIALAWLVHGIRAAYRAM